MFDKIFNTTSRQTKFWNWFSKNQSLYFGFESNQDFLFSDIARQLNKVDENLTFEFSPVLDNVDQITKNVEHYKSEHVKHCEEGNNCDINKRYSKMLYFLEQEFKALPKIVHRNNVEAASSRTKVFISYSHKDKIFLEELRRHFKPIEKYADLWDDTRIMPGQKWKAEIEKTMSDSKIALLLISADFFNSEFITTNELPRLLTAAEKDGATILTVILKPCLFEEYPEVNQYQAINNPSLPISAMDETTRERTWVELVKQIRDITKS